MSSDSRHGLRGRKQKLPALSAPARARKLLLVEWIDSWSNDRWDSIEEIERTAEPLYCRTIGWLVSKRRGMLVLVNSIAGERNAGVRDSACGRMAIPLRAVVRISLLRGG